MLVMVIPVMVIPLGWVEVIPSGAWVSSASTGRVQPQGTEGWLDLGMFNGRFWAEG